MVTTARCAECGASKDPDDRRDWGYGFNVDPPGRWYVCPECAEGVKQN